MYFERKRRHPNEEEKFFSREHTHGINNKLQGITFQQAPKMMQLHLVGVASFSGLSKSLGYFFSIHLHLFANLPGSAKTRTNENIRKKKKRANFF